MRVQCSIVIMWTGKRNLGDDKTVCLDRFKVNDTNLIHWIVANNKDAPPGQGKP